MQTPNLALGAAFVALALAAPVAAQEVTADTVVATVGGQDITIGHMIAAQAALQPQYQQLEDPVLYRLLLDQLIQQVALAQSVDEVSAVTRLTIENQRTGLLAGEAVRRAMEAAVTEEALQEAYEARFADAEPEQEFNASHILVETEEAAAALVAELEGGADFAALAREHSTGPSGPNGGLLGWFTKGMMVPEFEAAVLALEEGTVSAPVQTQFGWHVVRLNETRLKDVPPLEAVREELTEAIQRTTIQTFVTETVAATEVERSSREIDPSVLRDMSLIDF